MEYARGDGRGRTALDLVSTVRHDGRGGVADDLETVAGLADWLADGRPEGGRDGRPGGEPAGQPDGERGGRPEDEPAGRPDGKPGGRPGPQPGGLPAGPRGGDRTAEAPATATATEELRADVVRLRRAVRALFAHAVRPGPPSPADAHRLMPFEEALAHLNACAARTPVRLELHWEPDGEPHPGLRADEDTLVTQLARAAVEFLAGPERHLLRACTAPRCVRYYLQGHGRQEYCKPSCANRARAARHYRRNAGG
ncbi:ABATE domain-containing protein [Streptomyces sp. NPDC004111]|uniref:ABATE domain-containing protein n=1 Tax=Streptomyces sp. NPDC004111 TaxID=3364690 RepID=UPI0036849FD0